MGSSAGESRGVSSPTLESVMVGGERGELQGTVIRPARCGRLSSL